MSVLSLSSYCHQRFTIMDTDSDEGDVYAEVCFTRHDEVYTRITKFTNHVTFDMRVSGPNSPDMWRIMIHVPDVRVTCVRPENFATSSELGSAASCAWAEIKWLIVRLHFRSPGMFDELWDCHVNMYPQPFRPKVLMQLPATVVETMIPLPIRDVILRDVTGKQKMRRYVRAHEDSDGHVSIEAHLIDGSVCTLTHDRASHDTFIGGEADPHLKIRIRRVGRDLSMDIRSWHRARDISCIDIDATRNLVGFWMSEMGSLLSSVHDTSGFADECGEILCQCSKFASVSIVAALPGFAAEVSDDEDSIRSDIIEDASSSDDDLFPSDPDDYIVYSDGEEEDGLAVIIL